MSTIFGTSGSVFASAKTNTTEGRGSHFNFGNSAGGDALDLGAIVSNFNTRERDSFTVTRCLDGNNYLTVFGPDAQVTDVTLLTGLNGGCDGASETALQDIKAKFDEHRLSGDNPTLSSLVIGGRTISGYLIALSQSSARPELAQSRLSMLHPSNRDKR